MSPSQRTAILQQNALSLASVNIESKVGASVHSARELAARQAKAVSEVGTQTKPFFERESDRKRIVDKEDAPAQKKNVAQKNMQTEAREPVPEEKCT